MLRSVISLWCKQNVSILIRLLSTQPQQVAFVGIKMAHECRNITTEMFRVRLRVLVQDSVTFKVQKSCTDQGNFFVMQTKCLYYYIIIQYTAIAVSHLLLMLWVSCSLSHHCHTWQTPFYLRNIIWAQKHETSDIDLYGLIYKPYSISPPLVSIRIADISN